MNLLVFLRQTENRNRLQSESSQLCTRRIQLPLAPIDQNQIRQAHTARGCGAGGRFRRGDVALQSRVPAPDGFGHARKIILGGDGFHAEPAVIRTVRPALPEAHQRRHHERAADVRDVVTFNAGGRHRQTEDLAQGHQIRRRVQGHRQIVGHPLKLLRLLRGPLQILQRVAQLGGQFKFLFPRRPHHLRLQLVPQFLGLPLQEFHARLHLRQVLFATDIPHAGRRAVLQISVQTVFVVGLPRRERATTPELKLPAHHRQCPSHTARMRKRSEINTAIILPKPGEGEARNRILQVDLQQQKAFVVPEIDVEAGPELLDELAFQQERFRLGFHHVPVEIMNRLNQRVEFQIPALST